MILEWQLANFKAVGGNTVPLEFRNLTGKDVEDFPVKTPFEQLMCELGSIFACLIDYKANSIIHTREDQEYQEFDQSKSKTIIDEIDRVLARHYGFTAEELDFIAYYDLKYRLSPKAETEGEDKGEE